MKGIDVNRILRNLWISMPRSKREAKKREYTHSFHINIVEVFMDQDFTMDFVDGWVMDAKYAIAVLNKHFKDV